ncbi:MAG TPA: AAA family ATPase, partial [Polyangiaceae bacterium LLY-WYZ-15_(1-7)]|nr:AAA family ATPase [Polyangiaceae bacterium LLY-WYZ-15_(1-7)]
ALHAGRILVSAEGELEEDEGHERLLRVVRALADRAEAGQVLSTANAQRVARRFFDLRASGEAPEDAGEAYEVLGERNLTDSLGRFVGRREELRRVGEVLAIANKGRQCLLSLVGEAGSGKSRLLSETMRRLRLGGHDVGMHVCRVPPASKDVPLATAQEMLRVLLGIEEFDEEEEIVEKIGRLRELGMSKPELEAVTLALGLSVEDDEHGGRRPLRAAIARIALKLSEDRLSVFAFDDFDGVDEESLELLDALVRRPAPSRIVILVAHRPDGRIDWSDVPNYHEVRLGPLSDEDVARLTGARLGAEEVPMELLREVRAKSAGNPLYVEEYLLALQDADAIDLKDGRLVYAPDTAVDIPRSLRGIVAARLSRLASSHKQVLQVAAVIGGRFHDAMVARVIEAPVEEASEALEALVGRGLLARTGAREYGFAHGLIADVVTGTVPFEAKKELHRAIGEAFEAVYPDHLDELAERLAHHYREGGRRERAIDFLVRAADRLESEQSLGGAIGYLRRALEMLLQGAQPDRDRLLGLYRRVVQLCFRARELEQGLEVVEHALEMAEGLGRDEHVARFSLYKGQLCAFMNRFSEAQQWFERARQVARSVGNPDLLRLVTAAHAEAHTRNGEYGRAIGLLREALELARQANDVQAQIRCLIPLAHSYGGSGDRDAALAALEEARELAGDTPDRIIEVELLKTEALVRYYVGDLQIGLEAAHRGMELGKEYGFAYEAAVNAHNLGEFHLRLGDYKRAFAMLRYSYDVARDHGFVKLQYGNMRVLGFIDAVKLGSEEGRAKIIEAWNYAREHGYVWDLVQARYMLAIVDHAQGHHEDGRTGLREVLQLAGEYGMQHYERAAEEALAAIEAGLPVPMPS